MLYHRTSLVGHAWQLLDKGKNSNIAREDITDALCTSFNTQVNTLDKVRSKQEGEIKRMVIGSIYQTLNDMNLSSTEMVKIERALRKLMKQSK